LPVELEAAEGAAGRFQCLAGCPAKVGHHLVERFPQAVDVQAVEADFPPFPKPGVVFPQPGGPLGALLLVPHPRRPPGEGGQPLAGAPAGGGAALDEAADAVAVGPVALYGDEREPLLLDQPATDGGAPGVVFVSAV